MSTYEVFNQQHLATTIKSFANRKAAKKYARQIAGGGFDNGGVVRDKNYKSRAAIYHLNQGWDYSNCPPSWCAS